MRNCGLAGQSRPPGVLRELRGGTASESRQVHARRSRRHEIPAGRAPHLEDVARDATPCTEIRGAGASPTSSQRGEATEAWLGPSEHLYGCWTRQGVRGNLQQTTDAGDKG